MTSLCPQTVCKLNIGREMRKIYTKSESFVMLDLIRLENIFASEGLIFTFVGNEGLPRAYEYLGGKAWARYKKPQFIALKRKYFHNSRPFTDKEKIA